MGWQAKRAGVPPSYISCGTRFPCENSTESRFHSYILCYVFTAVIYSTLLKYAIITRPRELDLNNELSFLLETPTLNLAFVWMFQQYSSFTTISKVTLTDRGRGWPLVRGKYGRCVGGRDCRRVSASRASTSITLNTTVQKRAVSWVKALLQYSKCRPK